MKQQFLMCAVSGAMGAVIAVALMHDWHLAPVTAQDPPPSRRFGLPNQRSQPANQRPQPAAVSQALPLPVAVASRPVWQNAVNRPDLQEFAPEERVNIDVYEKANRSVVHIFTRSSQVSMFFVEVPSEGSGSGVVLDPQGHVLTNFHVIEGAREIRATLFDGETYSATLIGQDPPNDIAVLKINAPADKLFPIEMGDSSQLRVGQKVFALGNPFGLERTLTTGIVSSLNRTLPSRGGRKMKSMIQIDAALNRGNSGGPLLDSHGRLIGMNTAIASNSGDNSGVGFAIPSNTVRRVAPQLVASGRVVRPDLGITRVYQSDEGLVIATMSENGPAEQAGLRGFEQVRERVRRGPFIYEETRVDRSKADLILSVDGEPVKSADDLLTLVEAKRPGDRVQITVRRDGRELIVPVTLGSDDGA